MTKLDNTLDIQIGSAIVVRALEKEKTHISSGKLSASKLGSPLQWQILYVRGVPSKEIDEYTYRKFLRGNHVEDWLIGEIKCVDKQKFVEYRNVVGYADAIIDTKDWQFPCGIIPLEIKSVANSKFKRIVKEKNADRGHKLQAGLYALALGYDNFAVCYVAADDYRIHTYIYETKDIKEEIDRIIDRFDEAIKIPKVPEFEATESW